MEWHKFTKGEEPSVLTGLSGFANKESTRNVQAMRSLGNTGRNSLLYLPLPSGSI